MTELRLSYNLPVTVTKLVPSERSLRVTGIPEDVEAWRVKYFNDYHPNGYDTRLTKDVTLDGVRTIETWRGSTCD